MTLYITMAAGPGVKTGLAQNTGQTRHVECDQLRFLHVCSPCADFESVQCPYVDEVATSLRTNNNSDEFSPNNDVCS